MTAQDLAPLVGVAAGFGGTVEVYDYDLGGTGARVRLPNGYTLSVIPEVAPVFPLPRRWAGDTAALFSQRPGVVELALLWGEQVVSDVEGFESVTMRSVPIAAAAAVLARVAGLPSRPIE